MLWSPAVIELNKEISDILDQSHTLSLLNRQGMVDPDIFITKNNQLAEQLRQAKQQKIRLQELESSETIDATRQTQEALLERMGEGLMLTDVTGLHAGANPISGDFSLSAKGFRVRGGRKAEAVNQITVAGNFYRLLESVVAVGSDLEFGFPGGSRFGSPSLLVSELAVAGK